MSRCWKNTPTSSAIFAATRSIRRRCAGIDAFRTAIAALVPWVGDRAVQDAVAAANIL
jgi:hypothetical protein